MRDIWIAFGLTLFAGLATGIGSIIAFTAKRTNYRFLSIATGFSAGVMLYVSFVEIFVKGQDSVAQRYGDYWSHWIIAASFFGGMLLIGLIDKLIPSAENPHETHAEAETMPLHNPHALPPDFHHPAEGESAPEQGLHDHSPGHHKLIMTVYTDWWQACS
jgi:ZIP family zinc transporter